MPKSSIKVIFIPRDKRIGTYKGEIQIALEELTDIERKIRYQYKNKPWTATCKVENVIQHLKKAIRIFDKENGSDA
jgi:hypothetical protein